MDNKEREYVSWSDSYSVGIQLIDTQHKGLIDFANDLLNHSTGNEEEERAYFDAVIQQALEYVQSHFWTEEKCMLATQFPGYAEHKMAHDQFKLTIIKSVNEFKAGRVLVLRKFAEFLKDWVLSHIAVMDVQYNIYFKKNGDIKRDGKLGATLADVVQSLTH